MITKNEFYGAYLITLNKSVDDAITIVAVLREVEFAWKVIEELQREKNTGVFPIRTLPEDLRGPDVYTKDTPIIQRELTSKQKEILKPFKDMAIDGSKKSHFNPTKK